MSYSFTVQGATKTEVLEKIRNKLNAVQEVQSAHGIDCFAALQASSAFLSLLCDDESEDIRVAINGYVGGESEGFSRVNFGIFALHVPKE